MLRGQATIPTYRVYRQLRRTPGGSRTHKPRLLRPVHMPILVLGQKREEARAPANNWQRPGFPLRRD